MAPTGNMKTLLIPCIHTLLQAKSDATIVDLQRFLNEEPLDRNDKKGPRHNDALLDLGRQTVDSAHRTFFREKFRSTKYDSTKDALYTRLQDMLNSPVMRRMTVGKSTVKLSKIINGNKILILRLPKGEIGKKTAPDFGTLVLSLLQAVALGRAHIPARFRVATHVFVDEFHNFVSDYFGEIMEELAKFGLHMTLAQQYAGQGDDMSAKLRESILVNTAVKVAGRSSSVAAKRLAAEFSVSLDELRSMDTGRFYVQSLSMPFMQPVTTPTHLLDDSRTVDKKTWDDFVAYQLERYYRPVEEEEQPISHESGDGVLCHQTRELRPKGSYIVFSCVCDFFFFFFF